MSDTIIETPRLTLRQWRDSDLEPMAAINQDPKVMEHFPELRTFEETRAFIADNKRLYAQLGYCLYAVELKNTQEFMGWMGIYPADDDMTFAPRVVAAWRIATKFWGHGYATEAMLAVIDHAFNIIGLDELVTFTTPPNKRSERLMQRLGFVRNESEDFNHPKIDPANKLCRHVLYRLKKPLY